MKATKAVSREPTGRMCAAISPVYETFRGSCVHHICQHLDAQPVFGFPTTGWDQHQKPTRFESSQKMEQQTHPLTQTYFWSFWCPPRASPNHLPNHFLFLACTASTSFVWHIHATWSPFPPLSSHKHTCWERHISSLCVNVIFPRLHAPWGGAGGTFLSEQTAVQHLCAGRERQTWETSLPREGMSPSNVFPPNNLYFPNVLYAKFDEGSSVWSLFFLCLWSA